MTETTLHFACGGCGKRFRVGSKHAGRTTACPGCGEELTVPAADTPADPFADLVSFPCGLCGTRMGAPSRHIGKRVKCPDCHSLTVVPPPSPPQAKPKRPAAMDGEQYELYRGEQPHGADLARDEAPSVRFSCHVCQTGLSAPADAAGTFVACPDCRAETRVPAPPKPAPVPQEPPDEAVADYAVDDTPEGPSVHAGLYDDYASRAPAGYRNAADEKDPKKRREALLDTSADASGWGVGLLASLGTAFLAPGMLSAFTGLTLGLMVTVPMLGLVFVSGAFTGVYGVMLIAAASVAATGLWIGVASSIYWAVLNDSAGGARRVVDWPSVDPSDWVRPTLWLLVSNVVAAIPGALASAIAGRFAPGHEAVAGSLATTLALPYIQISQLDNDTMFGVVSGRVLRTMVHAPVTWAVFYAVILALTYGVVDALDALPAAIGGWSVLVIAPLTVGALLLYAWLVGRVAWAAGAATPERETE